uniref:Uncharacterized protein n=1 Tax=Setaria digitata TaxID=48799 RepID=A0A915Q2T7_9BILA
MLTARFNEAQLNGNYSFSNTPTTSQRIGRPARRPQLPQKPRLTPRWLQASAYRRPRGQEERALPVYRKPTDDPPHPIPLKFSLQDLSSLKLRARK